MLFLVMSTPVPQPPAAVAGRQRAFWAWMHGLREAGVLRQGWRRVGRGAVVVLDVSSHESLHELLAVWLEFIPATFEIVPLLPPPVGDKAAVGVVTGAADEPLGVRP